jgi:DNA-directed RNA polymerase specialized sigma24 family protein
MRPGLDKLNLVLVMPKIASVFDFGQKRNGVAKADYATASDFSRIFQEDQSSLYLLAFLLTANHQQAEECLVAGIEDAANGNPVFRAWARSWSKRTLIKNAIQLVLLGNDTIHQQPDAWSKTQSEAGELIDAVAALPVRERFVFVMSVLERYSDNDCSALLGCKLEDVRRARENALQQLVPVRPEEFIPERMSFNSGSAARG